MVLDISGVPSFKYGGWLDMLERKPLWPDGWNFLPEW
jgi:hypothetical protein